MKKAVAACAIAFLYGGIYSCHLFIDGSALLDKIEYADATHITIYFKYRGNDISPDNVEITVNHEKNVYEITAFMMTLNSDLITTVYHCTLKKPLVSGDVVLATPKIGARLYGSASMIVP
jgi:hypothetical protein